MKNEIILYSPDELAEHIEVRIDEETVWLSQQQMATLFNQSKQNISLHINNCFKEGELEKLATVKESLTVQKEGNRKVKRNIEYFNLDVIISVGYRVKSKQGTQFRIWANRVLKDYLLKGYAINNRINRLEDNMEAIKSKVNEIDLQIHSHLIPTQGIFFDGKVFDAYNFVADLVRKAEKSILVIDNYIDDSVLMLLSKKKENVVCTLLTKNISDQMKLDAEKFNKQYPVLYLKQFDKSHDRFLIIDDTEVYHLGASLKDLGKKWFAFSKLDKDSLTIINYLKEMI
ncbi:MAG: RhuM family protein [bacterium]